MSRSDRLPVARVSEYRLPIFRVNRRAPAMIETPWGDVRIERGNPGVIHRDLLDAIMACRQRLALDAIGQLHILFDWADVRRLLGTRADWSWARERLVDLVATVIAVRQRKSGDWNAYPILNAVADARLQAERRAGQFTGAMKKIVLSPPAARLLLMEMGVHLDEDVVRRVLGLQCQISRAVARWCLSHASDQVHMLDSVLDAVGASNGDRARKKQRAELRMEADALALLGIEISGRGRDARIRYTRQRGVWFQRLLNEDHER